MGALPNMTCACVRIANMFEHLSPFLINAESFQALFNSVPMCVILLGSQTQVQCADTTKCWSKSKSQCTFRMSQCAARAMTTNGITTAINDVHLAPRVAAVDGPSAILNTD